MLGTRCLLRQALLPRHYPSRPPPPTRELLQRADALLRERPTTTSACHTHLDTVYALIKDLQPRNAQRESWKAWSAKMKLWTHWLDGIRQLHGLGALALRKPDGRQRLKADDFTPLLLSLQSPSWMETRAAKEGTVKPDIDRVFKTMYELGLRPTPFHLMLALQRVPIGEMLGRAERIENPKSEALGGLDRVALQLRPMLRRSMLSRVGLRRRSGVRHHEVELQKLQHYVDWQVIEAVARGDARFEPALQAARESRAKLLASLLDKIVRADLGEDVRIEMEELNAAFLHIMDVLQLGTSPGFVDSEGKGVDLADPIEAYKLLVAGTDIFKRGGRRPEPEPALTEQSPTTASEPHRTQLQPPPVLVSIPPSAYSSLSITASPASIDPSIDPSASSLSPRQLPLSTPLSPDSLDSSPILSLTIPRPISVAAEHWARTPKHPARQCLKRLAIACARTNDFKGTLQLCAATTFPISGWRQAPYLAGAAQTTDDLRLLLPHLERLKVTPAAQAPVQTLESVPGVVWRLRRLALMLDAEALKAGEERERTYTERFDVLFRRWGVLPPRAGDTGRGAAPILEEPDIDAGSGTEAVSLRAEPQPAARKTRLVRDRPLLTALYTATVPASPRVTPAPTTKLDRLLLAARSATPQ